MSAKKSNVRGAGAPRSGATDTTMLIWKTIDATPGITRDEIFAKIEHEIPAGWAKRRYGRHAASKIKDGDLTSSPSLILSRARRYVLTEKLSDMRRWRSIAGDHDGGYWILRELVSYKGNRDHVDESGRKAAEHLNAAYALPVVEAFVSRTENLGPRGKSRPTAKEWEAIKRVAQASRVARSTRPV